MINEPFLDGKAALRLAFDQCDSGFAHDTLDNRAGIGAAQTTGGRASLLLQPTQDVRLRLSASQESIFENGVASSYENVDTHRPLGDGYDEVERIEFPLKRSLDIFSADADVDLHFAKFTSITANSFDRSNSVTDSSLIYDPILASTDAFGVPIDNTNSRSARRSA